MCSSASAVDAIQSEEERTTTTERLETTFLGRPGIILAVFFFLFTDFTSLLYETWHSPSHPCYLNKIFSRKTLSPAASGCAHPWAAGRAGAEEDTGTTEGAPPHRRTRSPHTAPPAHTGENCSEAAESQYSASGLRPSRTGRSQSREGAD